MRFPYSGSVAGAFMHEEIIRCSFCGKDKSDTLILIAGIDGHICEVCVEQAEQIINDELESKIDSTRSKFVLPENITPVQINEFLDEYRDHVNGRHCYVRCSIDQLNPQPQSGTSRWLRRRSVAVPLLCRSTRLVHGFSGVLWHNREGQTPQATDLTTIQN